ncbi:UNVERIFIED_CONTAM: Transcription factor TFIIIB component B [Sesamum indicum]
MGIDLDPLDDIFADEAVKNVISGLDVVFNDDGGWHASIEKSGTENADIFIGLEALGDFLPHTTSDMAEGTIHPSEEVALNVHNHENTGGGPAPVLSSVGDSNHTCKVADVPTCHELSAAVDPLTAGEPIVSSSDGCGRMHVKELGREEMDIMDSINASEVTTNSGHRTGKFQPKPKLQMHEVICKPAESLSCSLGSQSFPPEISYTEKDFSPTFQQDDVLDLSSLGFTHTLPTEASSELPLNEESMNLTEMTQLDSGIPLECPPEIPAKLASRRAKIGRNKTQTASDPSQQQQKTSTSSQENEMGRSLRPRKSKTNFCELGDEVEDGVHASEEFSEECPVNSAAEEENVDNEEFQVESDSQMKKVKQKFEKPVRKRKETEASDKDAKPKKFSHSTRRRRVDKVLLATPEDEIDYQKVPLRDLILLAEHKEREMAYLSESVRIESYFEQDEDLMPFATENVQVHKNTFSMRNDVMLWLCYSAVMVILQADTIKKRPLLLNKMENIMTDKEALGLKRAPSASIITPTWTEHPASDGPNRTQSCSTRHVFLLRAVRQFGTDLSMIQQLFPDRTRRQVKLKYKKEERQHPLRLREALTNRTKDHSHFEKVIERLKQIAAEENQNADNDESIDLTGNEVDEGTLNAGCNDEAPWKFDAVSAHSGSVLLSASSYLGHTLTANKVIEEFYAKQLLIGKRKILQQQYPYGDDEELPKLLQEADRVFGVEEIHQK